MSHEHPLLLRFAVEISRARRSRRPPSSVPNRERQKPVRALRATRSNASCATMPRHYAEAAFLPAEDGTSRMSAHLSFGTISSRAMVSAVRERLRDALRPAHERASLRAFLRALARRDFFLQLAWFHPRSSHEPLQEKMRGFSFVRSHPRSRRGGAARPAFRWSMPAFANCAKPGG